MRGGGGLKDADQAGSPERWCKRKSAGDPASGLESALPSESSTRNARVWTQVNRCSDRYTGQELVQ